MSWLSIVKVAFEIFLAVLDYAKAKYDQGATDALENAKNAALEGLRRADDARKTVADDAAAHPERLRDDDGHRRPGGRKGKP